MVSVLVEGKDGRKIDLTFDTWNEFVKWQKRHFYEYFKFQASFVKEEGSEDGQQELTEQNDP